MEGKQLQIGDNGEVVTISLAEYEDLLEDRRILNDFLFKHVNDEEDDTQG